MSGLANGTEFPALELPAVGGGMLRLPQALEGAWGVVLVYRGHWCPYCNAQLNAFQRALPALQDEGIQVAALSVDSEDRAAEVVHRYNIGFPIGYGADADVVSRTLQSYADEDPVYLESSGFLLDPSGRIVVAVYSSNAIGRLLPEDVRSMVRYLRQPKAA
ncbi:MAG: peroxiredoxin family protein [Acidimicrobiales bacterium]|jgi:peroxiredoxin